MAEHRLIDANVLLQYMSDMEVQTGKKCCTQAVKSCIEEFFPQVVFDQPTIDPEALPIVRQLRDELEKVTAERNIYKIFFNDVTACGDCNDISAIKAAEKIAFAKQTSIPRDQWQDAAEVME